MIRVDIVLPTGGDVGGIENVVFSWTKHLDPLIFDLRIFHCHQGTLYLHGYPKAYCINRPFEIANVEDLVAAYYVFVRDQGAPDICIAANWPMMTKACAVVKAKMGLDPMRLVSWVHNKIGAYYEEGLGGIEDLLYADAHFAINSRIAKGILEALPGACVHEIGNPVDMRRLSKESINPLVLTYVGRLSYIKRIDIILEAVYRAKADWKLKIVGDGEIREDVCGWIEMLGLGDAVELCGWSDDPWECCKESGILVIASEYEGFGLVAFEASSTGKTVITTPVDGISDYIVNGENGYYYPYEDAETLARILDGISAGSLKLCDPNSCRKSVEAYSTENYFKRVEEILKSA